MKNIRRCIWFMGGVSVFVFFFWLGGGDVPTERGIPTVFYTVFCLCFGALGGLIGEDITTPNQQRTP